MVVVMEFEKSTEGTHVYSGPYMRSLYIKQDAPIFDDNEPPKQLLFTITKVTSDPSKMEDIG